MPRDKFNDPTVRTRYVQVNWRRQTDTDEPGPQYVQVSTHNDGNSTVSELLGAAIGLVSNVDAPNAGWPAQSDEWRTAARAWLDKVTAYSDETTGEFVQVESEQIDGLIKTLHKAKRQAFGATVANEEIEGPTQPALRDTLRG